MRTSMYAWIAGMAFFAATGLAAAVEVRVPLRDGKVSLKDMCDAGPALARLHLRMPDVAVDVRGVGGSLLVAAMNKSLGDGCRLSVDDDELVLHVDPAKLPHDVDGAKQAARVFTATAT